MCSWAAVLQHRACVGLELLARKLDIKEVQKYHHVNYQLCADFCGQGCCSLVYGPC